MLTSTVGDAILSAAAIIADPALPQVVSLVKQLRDIEAAKAKATVIPGGVPAALSPGIGLSAAITPLKIVIYTRKNPWVTPVAIAGVVGIPLLLGFFLGRASNR